MKEDKRDKKVKIFKIFLLFMIIGLITGMIIYIFPVIKGLSTIEGQVAFRDKVQNTGIYGMLSLFGLQVAQIFLVIVPGEPIEILAGMCYGAIGGAIFIMISAFIISAIIFLLVKKFGRNFIYNFCEEKEVGRLVKNKLFKNPKKVEMVMFIMFFVPGLPKDILVYIAGLLPIKASRFLAISSIARFPSVISSTLAGANLIMGNWKFGVILYAGVLVTVAIVIYLINKFDKSKTTEEVLKSINENK